MTADAPATCGALRQLSSHYAAEDRTNKPERLPSAAEHTGALGRRKRQPEPDGAASPATYRKVTGMTNSFKAVK